MAHWLLSRSCHGPLLVFGDCNARLHAKLDSDPYFIGPHIFGDGRANFDTDSNRSLLLELCECCRLIVGNTFFPQPANKQVTYYNIGAQPSSEIIPANFGQLDFLLVQHDWLACVSQLYSCMDVPLASHHFLVIAELTIQVPKRNTRTATHAINPPALRSDTQLTNRFAALVEDSLDSYNNEQHSQLCANDLCPHITNSMRVAAGNCLNLRGSKAKRPWISDATLALIDRRVLARRSFNFPLEKQLTSEIKASVRRDRSTWLERLLHTGEWKEIRKPRKGSRRKHGRLRDQVGSLKESDERADTFATFLESTQWSKRPVTAIVSDTMLGPTLPVSCDDTGVDEVVEAARNLKHGKAAGPDGLPPEFWKSICKPNSRACVWAVALCNRVWHFADVPKPWHEALVTAVFKKGIPVSAENYRPISLLAVGYKLFASVLLRRLKSAGAESGIWHTQFGFRSQRGTVDAIFVARRLLEQTLAHKDEQLVFLALDWSKAFDSVDPDRLSHALFRFGVPPRL